MYFLISAAAFAAFVLLFNFVVTQSRKHPELFAGDWRAMLTSIFFTTAFSGSLGVMLSTAVALAPNVVAGIAIAVATAAVIVMLLGMILRRRRASLPGAPQAG